MSLIGLLLLAAAGMLAVVTGLPVFAVLIGAAIAGAVAAVAVGVVPAAIFNVLANRILALLEHDLLQALPLYVFMGALIERMRIAPGLIAGLQRLPGAGRHAPLAPVILLGALTGPMNGSVSANVIAVARSAGPLLATSRVPKPLRLAAVTVAGTLGIVVPPSLVLILLADAMMAAHTIAANATGRMDRIVNTQDVFRATLPPTVLFVAAAMLIASVLARRASPPAPETDSDRTAGNESATFALACVGVVVALLGGVAAGYLYAVEAAATGAVVLLAIGLISGRLLPSALPELLSDTLVTTGVLFAPLVAATTFTLVLRTLGTDRLVADWLTALPGGETAAIGVVLATIAISALVLDAFEIIFVVVPLAVPPLLMRVPDAVWVSTLVLLTLQASYLLPPAGTALIMTRNTLGLDVPARAQLAAVAPYLAALLAVIGIVLWQPRLVHILDAAMPPRAAAPAGKPTATPDFNAPAPQLQSPSLSGPPSFK